MAIENANEMLLVGYAEELVAGGKGWICAADEMRLETSRELLVGRLERLLEGVRGKSRGVLWLFETMTQALPELTRIEATVRCEMDALMVTWPLPEGEWETFLAMRDAYAYPADGTYPIRMGANEVHEPDWRAWKAAREAKRQPTTKEANS